MSPGHPHILVVDDEPNIRKLLTGTLEDEGFAVTTAQDVDEMRERLAETAVDAILLDVMLPGTDGLAFLRGAHTDPDLPPVIMMSGHGTIQTAVEATRLGAIDFIEKPIAVERLLLSIENALRMARLRAENAELRRALVGTDEILGTSAVLAELREQIAKAAPAEARVLISGENGTGKELVARALVSGSPRAERAFIKVNCAAIPSELLESELFGHEKGAFTGALSSRRGKFELAQGGTLLLDEIGDMNPTTQAKLLRVLEEEEMERVGGESTIALDVRVLASTNQDLERRMEDGEFRRDLYHRLKVVPIHVAALREHADDVGELARHYLDHFCREHGRRALLLGDAAEARLGNYAWPGNVRELKNLMERLVIMVDGDLVELEHVVPLLAEEDVYAAADTGPDGRPLPLAERLEIHERALIARAIADSGGNVAEAARRLGLDRANLHRKIQRLGLGETGP